MRSVSAGILKKIFFGSSGKNLIKLCINQKYEVMTLLHYIRASCNDGKLLRLRVRHVPKKKHLTPLGFLFVLLHLQRQGYGKYENDHLNSKIFSIQF